jgi:quercetin dioxygenase-like cupin family protein
MHKYKVNFDTLKWESPMTGVRHKYFDQDGIRIRLVEYTNQMPEHWCEKGHYGIVLSGKIEIEYENTKEIYSPGDAIIIPNGATHKHKGKTLTDSVEVFFIENM